MDAVIHCGDCLEIMGGFESGSVDLVLCSPPYEAARTYGIGFNLRGQGWVDWCVERYVECLRICRGLVAWVVEGQTRNYRYSAAPLLLMADLHRRGVHLRKPPVFVRNGIPGSGGPDWLRNDYELIVCATNGGKLPWSDNTAMGHPPKWAPGGAMSYRLTNGERRDQWGGSSTRNGSTNERRANGSRKGKGRPSHVLTTKSAFGNMPSQACGREGYKRRYFNGKGHAGKRVMTHEPILANPGNIIRGRVGGGAMGSKLAHDNEAPFPEWLAEFFVRSFCPPGGTVLDCFSGSGTTGAVALKTGRKYIGIDIRQSQVDLTRRRLAEIQPELIA